MPKLSPHPGVTIFKRKRKGWRAQWRDPLTRKLKEKTLLRLGLKTQAARRDWAIQLSRQLEDLKQQILFGRVADVIPLLQDAIEDYLARAGERLRKPTIRTYRFSLNNLLNWANRHGIREMTQLTRPRLVAFRDWLTRRRVRGPSKGKKRGTREATQKLRSPASTNHDLRAVQTFLDEQRRLGRLPHITRDDLIDSLRKIREPRSRPTFLRRPEIKALLKACLKHDRDTFTETREEHVGIGERGTTPCNPSVGAFTLTVLLTGMRLREARELRWSSVFLDDEEIILKADETKTGHERAIRLAESPILVQVLSALKLQSQGRDYVFGGTTPRSENELMKTRYKMKSKYGAPNFSWQRLRQTTATFLTNAPGIYGAAAAFLSAKRLGHSVMVAERRYVGLVPIEKDAETLEQAMDIEILANEIVLQITAPPTQIRTNLG